MKVSIFSRKVAAKRALMAAGISLSIMAIPVHAQEAEQASPQGAIVIPDDVMVFGANDPNYRRATAIVNGAIITGTDVDQRTALILSSSQAKISPEELQRLRLQVLRNLIDETLQIQEAKSQDIAVDEKDVEQTFARVAQQNFGQNTKALEAYLNKIGSSAGSLKHQIRGELSWQHLLQRNVHPFVKVSEGEVKESLDRLRAAKGTEEYRIGEIYLAAPQERQEAIAENARKIIEQLKEGASFAAMARTYSEASTKVVGGDLGWIRLAQLPPELASSALSLTPGQ
jgi:peptidyl-prolyl cis-trans isomerase SurA